MEMENESPKKGKGISSYLLIILIAALIAAVCVFSVGKLRRELYEERAYNSVRIMDKLSVSIQTVIEGRMDALGFEARLLAERSFSDSRDAADYLARLERTGGGRDILLLIDSEGSCLASDTRSFRWEESGALNAGDSSIIISNMRGLGLSDEQMLFLTPLPNSVSAGDRSFTHMCLVMSLESMGRYMGVSDYGENSAVFIIHDDGTYIYKFTGSSAFSGVFNLIAKLENWDYRYKTGAVETIANIRGGNSGCACVAVDGVNYFVVYSPLNVNDWTAVLLAPESEIGGHSSNFMGAVIGAVLLLAAMVMALTVGIIVMNHLRSMRQQALINEQLHRAAEAERGANSAKTRFLSSMSHDIRTPMNAIIGMTAIAEKHINDTGYVMDCLSKIKLASGHLLTLINDILDISKIESGKMTLSPVVFSLADSVNNMFNIVRPQAKAKRQDFDINIGGIVHEYLMADELRLNQIYINLLTNAIKYTPEDGRISVSISEEPAEDGRVKLTYVVRDTGIGMTEEFMENMYGSFSRATDTRVNKIQGTGLGLSICKQLVELMGGTIDCESVLGEGTTFTVTLTLDAAEQPPGDYRLPNLKLLLADDDDIFLQSAADILGEMGVEVESVTDGSEAVSRVMERHSRNEDYSVVMMDWKMSGMDGIEATRLIHNMLGDRIPIILISAYDSSDIEQAAVEAGAIGFLRKPFFKASLYQHLSQYLKLDDEPVSDGTALDLAGLRVLVAEDNDLNWEIAEDLLEMSGIIVERAENGQICVDRLKEAYAGEFDAVLMDVQMPVMNGRDAARAIRRMEGDYSQIPIIAMTADAFAEDVSACLKAGMNGHVSKPIDLDKLFLELRKIKREGGAKGGSV